MNPTEYVSMRDYVDLRIQATTEAANQRFDAQQLALKDALIAQEKAVSAALDNTREAINKADTATDKRFDLMSEKIDGVIEILNRNAGAQGIYVTHTDLNNGLSKLQTSLEETLKPLVTFMNSQQGKSSGMNNLWGLIVGGIFLFIAVVGFFLREMGA